MRGAAAGTCAGVVGAICAASLATASSGAGPSTLAACVRAFNGGGLGLVGRVPVKYEATFGTPATMFGFKDGACGLVFRQVGGSSLMPAGVFVTFLHGTYSWSDSPLTGSGSAGAAPTSAALLALATPTGNVHVNRNTGRVTAISGRRLVRSRYTIQDAGLPCRLIAANPTAGPVPDTYLITGGNVACKWTRTLVFAYVAGQGTLLHGPLSSPTRKIVGWRCAGAREHGQAPPPQRSLLLTCTRGSARFTARSQLPHVYGQATGQR